MSRCLKWRERFVGPPREPPPKALDALETTLVQKYSSGRYIENVGLRATRLVVAAALAGRLETTKMYLSFLIVPNRNILRQAFEETGFVLWDPNRKRKIKI
ncbi:hypothetical protein A3D71_03375 [Candidatus Kaiserbacteria bacterium RIFCSPHIGHO2_02_FULL_55_20]|uniref:Uncharacterized protein n=1 Tax=Candidatus Kaiserbacteria bacterium RIFCSPHIGHO2_02_FULL_55_20 TaxID=1798497 RepID=A0A1F6DXE7_9BACT|nr:MAG: hypothetical protein A2680_03260 [Candidatus Kaiserbacteria bacterium RIFCSPHIGHO2_01_FULL_55_37]OGG66104.1 MAG: hypothetical protein A3D71_03375 [Candidatus Kaiserbacteria bacterium RIFCSPHIGHO2_02_FULL_55_20]